MKKKLFIILPITLLISLLVIVAASPENPMITFSRTYESSIWFDSVAVQTNDGGYALVGSTGSYSGGGGGSDICLVKTNSNGDMQWNKTFGGPYDDFGYSLIQTNDGGYAITGSMNFYTGRFSIYQTDVYLVKTDSKGDMQWNKTFGGPYDDFGYSLIQTNDGGYAIASVSEGINLDLNLIKTDSNGNLQWSRIYAPLAITFSSTRSIIQTNDGGYALVGRAYSFIRLVKTDSNGNERWSKIYSEEPDHGNSVIQTKDGGYAILGDERLIKTDSKGDMQWNKTYGLPTYESNVGGNCLIQTDDGGYAIGGNVARYYPRAMPDAYLVKTDLDGDMEWSKTYGRGGWMGEHSIIQTNDGGYALAGETSNPVAGTFLIKTDLNGNAINPQLLQAASLTVVNGTSSYYISMIGLPVGYFTQNSMYTGWCVDKSTVMIRSRSHNVTLYSSLNKNLPISISGFNWNAVNYILNHKQGSMKEIQDAIWYFVPDQQAPPTNESDAIAMINAALAHPDYMPTTGDLYAVIAYTGSPSGVQNTILEYTVP